MKKVQVLVHRADIDTALTIFQRASAAAFHEIEIPETSAPSIEFPHANLLPRVQHAVTFLLPYAPKVTLWRTLRDGTFSQLSETDVKNKNDDTDVVIALVDDLEHIQVEFADANEKVRFLEEQIILLAEWKNLPIRLKDLETVSTKTFLLKSKVTDVKKDAALSVATRIATKLQESAVASQVTSVSDSLAAVTIAKEVLATNISAIFDDSLVEVVIAPSGKETPEVEFMAVSESLAAAKGEVALLHDQAEHFAITHLKQLKIATEVLTWQRDRYAAVQTGVATTNTIMLEGWLNQNKRAAIQAQLLDGNVAAMIVDVDSKDEEPPVEIENSTFIQPFEIVTRLYGMPGYKDLDPTVFLAGFFFLFFGLSLTDVGYGIFLMAVSAIILTLFTVAPIIRTFAKLLLFMGLSSALVGLLFGGYLGIDPELLPASLRAIQLFDPIGSPLPVFYLALGLGVFQVMVGMVLKIVSDAKNGELVGGLMDQGPWLAMFSLAILYLATTLEYVSVLGLEQIINLIYVDIVVIILSSGRKGKTIAEKLQKSALGLYNSIGYFSDILSYSRLLALGLATTALAFAVNLIAEIVSGSVPYLGPVLAVVVLVVGHLFTLAVNTLGAFIHSARLQFVEFFGKFIAGTGKEFKPLSRKQQYVTVSDE